MLAVYIVFALSLAVATVFIVVTAIKKVPLTHLILKGAASLAFVAVGLVAAFKSGAQPVDKVLLLLGLFFGLLGDAILALKEIFPEKSGAVIAGGIGAFLTGHVFYIVYFARIAGVSVWPFVTAAVLFVVTAVLLRFTGCRFGKLLIPAFLYVAVITVMMGFGTAGMARGGAFFIISGIAVLLFGISDIILSYLFFHPKCPKQLSALNLSTYYLAQNLLALAVIFLTI